MPTRRRPLLVEVFLCAAFLAQAAPQPDPSTCGPASGDYEGFKVVRVGIKTPLELPVEWVNKLLLGKVVASLQPLVDQLPVKKNKLFHFADHIQAMIQIRDTYGVLNPGERLKLALVLPKLSACNTTAKTIEIDYHVYTTDALYYVSRLLETKQDQPSRGLTIGPESETAGKAITVPVLNYDKARHLFGGVRSVWNGTGSILNQASIEASGSSSSHVAAISLGGSRDPDDGPLSHMEWKAAYRNESDPAGSLALKEATGLGQFLAATRAHGPLNFIARFGGALEGGYRRTDNASAASLADAPYRALKLAAGGVWNAGRTIGEASYGFQAGTGNDRTPVDFKKHIVDISEQIRILPVEHRTLRLDLHFNAGWLQGASNEIPTTERFFGGNFTDNFIDSSTWLIQASPLIRSFPHNQLDSTLQGGTNFQALNATLAFTAWGYPAIPPLVRNAKEVGNGINDSLKLAETASLEDFRARTKEFNATLPQVAAVKTSLVALQQRLTTITATAGLSDMVKSDISGLASTISDTLDGIADAQSRTSSGVAWKDVRNLALDSDGSQLAIIRDSIRSTVAPDLVMSSRATDAADLNKMADALEAQRKPIAMQLSAIEPHVVLDPHRFDAIKPAADAASAHAKVLRDAALAVLTPATTAATALLANSTRERSAALVAPFIDDNTPFDSLYDLTSLAIGIGKLVRAQLADTISSSQDLVVALRKDGRTADADTIAAAAAPLTMDLKILEPLVKALPVPPGDRWARQQNSYFKRALDVTFRELNLAAVSPAVLFDAAHLGPSLPGLPSFRYGLGPAIRFSVVTFDVTVGYSFNLRRPGNTPAGAFFFSMDVSDLFR